MTSREQLGPVPRLLSRGELPDDFAARVAELAKNLGVSPLTLELCARRGIPLDEASLRACFAPRLSDLVRPEKMAGYDEALQLLETAIDGQWRVGVFGDYDVDGVSTAALVSGFLEALGVEVSARVADRERGYGLQLSVAKEFAVDRVQLLIACDCGTSDVESLAWLREQGIRTIVIDHHQAPEVMPPTDALLNPHQPGCEFPFKGMCSAGVGFYLCAGLRTRLLARPTFELPIPDPRQSLDLVALASVCDMVPMKGNNRIFVHHGLRQLTARTRPGIDALLTRSGTQTHRPLDEGHVGFVLGPRLNAPGRLASARPALELLRTTSRELAAALAGDIERLNSSRKRHQGQILEHADRLLREDPEIEKRRGIVLADESWLPGVVGIAAANLVQRYRRPALVLGRDPATGEARGSARTWGQIDVLEALRACSHLATRCGGHRAAAGVSLPWEGVPEFAVAFDEALSRVSSDGVGEESHDGELDLSRVDMQLLADIRAAGPYGIGFPEPRFLVSNASVVRPRPVGASHMAFSLMQRGAFVDAIAFDCAHLPLRDGTEISCLVSLQLNEFAGRSRLQLRIHGLW